MTPMRDSQPRHLHDECGAALLTVLVLLTILTSLAVTITAKTGFSIKRADTHQQSEQARWYALGAEALAIESLRQSLLAAPNKTTLDQPWATQAGRFPIPGGFIEGRLSDGGNCFNINHLVGRGDDGTNQSNEPAIAQLRSLLIALDIAENEIESLVGPLVDWIDSDSRPYERGAEDFDYLGLQPPHRTPNSFIADITELRGLRSMTTPLYLRVAPFLCALPTTERSRININTLRPEDAPLLVMLVDDETFGIEQAIQVLASRPSAGFRSAQEFWALPNFDEFQINEDNRQQVDIRTRFFRLNSRVAYVSAFVQLEAMLDAIQADVIRVRWRRLGFVE